VPGVAAAVALIVSVELFPAVTEVGASEAVTPAPPGLTVALRLMVPAIPLATVLIELVAAIACWMLRVTGDALMLKSGGGGTTTVTVVECIAEPSVPVTVTV